MALLDAFVIVDADSANDSRPDNIHYLPVDTTLMKDGHHIVITQSFPLPQGQYPVTRNNVKVHTTHGYVSVDPLALPPVIFKVIITEPARIDVPCEMVSSVFVHSRAALNPVNLYFTVHRYYARVPKKL